MNATDEFVIQKNLENFRKLLGTILSFDQRRMILELIADEERKLQQYKTKLPTEP
jgi:hypothetical protein